MEINNSILGDEITAITSSGQTQANYGWSSVIDYGGTELYKPLKLIGITIKRNYITGFTDEVTCRLLMPLGKYARRIYPNRNKLEIVLTKFNIGELVQSDEDKESKILTERYTAILLNQQNSPTEAQGMETVDEESLDTVDLIELDFQLINKGVEQLRMIQIGGIYSNTQIEQVLLSLLTNESKQIVVDNKKVINGVDLIPINNKEIKQHIVIPQGTSLVDVPGFLQKRIGVYNSGLGSYIQDKYWYIYNLYDTTKFQDRLDTCTFIILPSTKYYNIERTYRVYNGSKTVLITGETSFSDSNNTNNINYGSGLRLTDADKLMESTSKTVDNKTIIARGKLNTEVTTNKNKDNVSYSPIIGNNITSNLFANLSELNSRNGGILKVVWHNADLSLLRPAIASKLLFDDNGKIVTYYGVLIRADYVSASAGSITGDRYSNQALLFFFVNKQT